HWFESSIAHHLLLTLPNPTEIGATMTIFDDWRDGTISDVEAVRGIASDLGEIESQLAPLEAERQNLRDQLSQIVSRLGARASVAGFGKIELTAPSVARSYDKKRLDQLIIDL